MKNKTGNFEAFELEREREKFKKSIDRVGRELELSDEGDDNLDDLDFDDDLELDDLDLEDGDQDAPEFETRYFAPPKQKKLDERFLKFEHAKALAAEIQLSRDCRFFVVVNGSFYFGDFVEALVARYNFYIKKMTVQTLSLNQNNVDSFANLLLGGYVDEFNLIVSDFFFAHERRNLIPYIYAELDTPGSNKFQLAAARTHCKMVSIETHDGVFLNIHGSANLRTSDNLEQIVIEDNRALYEFNDAWQTDIIEKYKTINKSVAGRELWKTINKTE